MTKRALTGVLALGLAFGAAACDKQLDKEGTKDNLMEGGATEEQASCIVDGLDSELSDDAIDTLIDDGIAELDADDQAKIGQIFTDCDAGEMFVGGASTPDTTAGG